MKRSTLVVLVLLASAGIAARAEAGNPAAPVGEANNQQPHAVRQALSAVSQRAALLKKITPTRPLILHEQKVNADDTALLRLHSNGKLDVAFHAEEPQGIVYKDGFFGINYQGRYYEKPVSVTPHDLVTDKRFRGWNMTAEAIESAARAHQ